METTGISPVTEPAAPPEIPSKFRAFLKRRTRWLICAILLTGACVLVYHWAFGKAFGFIFQRYILMSDLSAVENAEVPAVYRGMDKTPTPPPEPASLDSASSSTSSSG
jgi:hypothetical protein